MLEVRQLTRTMGVSATVLMDSVPEIYAGVMPG